jgi:hypothetical protein
MSRLASKGLIIPRCGGGAALVPGSVRILLLDRRPEPRRINRSTSQSVIRSAMGSSRNIR